MASVSAITPTNIQGFLFQPVITSSFLPSKQGERNPLGFRGTANLRIISRGRRGKILFIVDLTKGPA
jgi:hypothetical protein